MRNVRDLLAGLLILAVGLFFLVGALSYSIGTPMRMGAGYFPLVLSIITILLSIWVIASSWKIPTEFPTVQWRPLLAVVASISVFILGSLWLGLVPAVFLTVVVAILGHDSPNLARIIVLSGVITLITWLVFRVGLGLQIPPFRSF